MEFKVDDRMKEKIKLVAVSLGILLGFFLFFRYIFPFIWPIVVSVCLALMIYPAVRWLHRRLHINKIVGTIFILLLAEEFFKLESHYGASRQPERQSETHT